MKYVVIFSYDFEEARRYAGAHNLARGWWTFAHSAERIKHVSPEHCESVFVGNWASNLQVREAHRVWNDRRKQTA